MTSQKTEEVEALLAVFFAALDRRDFDAVREMLADDFEYLPMVAAIDHPEPIRGAEAFVRWWKETEQVISNRTFEIESSEQRGDWVLLTGRIIGVATNSEVPVSEPAVLSVRAENGVSHAAIFDPDLETARARIAQP